MAREKATFPIPKGFPSELLKPMPRLRRGFGVAKTGMGAGDWAGEYFKRFAILKDHYLSEPTKPDEDWKGALLHSVLRDWIPGFRETAARNQPNRKAEYEKRRRLLSEVQELRARDSSIRSDTAACKSLSKDLKHRKREFYGISAETLRDWLRDARLEQKVREQLEAKFGPEQAEYFMRYGDFEVLKN